ncbi:hypothetical protein GGS24DRAFT_455450 [Hypoxylon argillaceum]|nr:hypothetical protein GGS24DRAFT_455450 [Hypoxylon argillaceum]
MSPKVDGKASAPARAWSRDVRPDSAGVTYSRRSYYYDREFSDSIVPPTDTFERASPDGRRAVPLRIVGPLLWSPPPQYEVAESAGRYRDPFAVGRVLQSASGGSNDEYELQDRGPVKAPRVPLGVQPQASPAADSSTPVDAERRLTIAGLDVRTIAQGIVVVADALVRIAETYQRIQDEEGDGEDDELAGLGLDLDPCHLEAGPPRRGRRISPAPKTTTGQRRALMATTSAAARAASAVRGQRSTVATAEVEPSSLPPPASKRVCYYLVATVAFGVVASFGIALWWAQSQGDASAGFTIGGYVIAVVALAVAVVSLVHRPSCQCWAK